MYGLIIFRDTLDPQKWESQKVLEATCKSSIWELSLNYYSR